MGPLPHEHADPMSRRRCPRRPGGALSAKRWGYPRVKTLVDELTEEGLDQLGTAQLEALTRLVEEAKAKRGK